MKQFYVRVDFVENPDDETPVMAVGVHPLRWRDVVDGVVTQPTMGFREATPEEIAEATR